MPRDRDRIPDILEELREFWEAHPDWRLGQIVSNANHGADPFCLEDDEFLVALDDLWTEHP